MRAAASASLHYAGLPPLIGNDCHIAEHADVANALGAVVGQVRMSAEARVSQPEIGLFRHRPATPRFLRRSGRIQLVEPPAGTMHRDQHRKIPGSAEAFHIQTPKNQSQPIRLFDHGTSLSWKE